MVEQIQKSLREMRSLVHRKLDSLGASHDADFERQLDAYEKQIENIVSLPRLRFSRHFLLSVPFYDNIVLD